MQHEKHILLLQGPASMFFAHLGQALRLRGAKVTRLTFCPGDWLYWRRSSGQRLAFRGQRQQYPEYLLKLVRQQGITDIICLGDGRFWHQQAIKTLKSMPDPPIIHIVEHGYYRPGWLTLEQDGINANSRFNRQPKSIICAAAFVEMPVKTRFKNRFLTYALMDIGWNLSNTLFAWASYPHFKTHALDSPLREWRGWIGKALRYQKRQKSTDKTMQLLAKHKGPIFIFALQLATDYQIRAHGPRDGLVATVQKTIADFNKNAPQDALLVFKVHPLDNGRIKWQKIIARAALNPRVIFLAGGDLHTLFKAAAGCISINSTVGLSSIDQGLPTYIFGDAIYKINGLTSNQNLADFWHTPLPPNPELATAFKKLLLSQTQISGAFDGSGAKTGALNIACAICPESTASASEIRFANSR